MISSKYKNLYLSTTRSQLKDLSALILKLEKKSQDLELLEELFRLIHSMKGAAATMGLKKTVGVFHTVEDIIQATHNNNLSINKDIIDVFLQTVKILEDNLKQIEKTNKEISFTNHTKELNKILKNQTEIKKVKKNIKQQVQTSSFLDNVSQAAEVMVPSQKLNDMQNIFDDLMIGVMRAKSIVKNMEDQKLLSSCMQIDKLTNDLMKEFQELRIVPLSQIFSSLSLMVRDIAKEENKKVKFNISDNNLSIDKGVLDEIVEIIIQLIRNAVVHGISSQQQDGAINLEARLRDDRINIIVADNGNGIDWTYILKTAVKNKLITKAQAKKMTAKQKQQLIFTSGISSAKELSTRSGRGIGLGVVRQKINELGGDISVESVKGKGSIFTVDIPLPFSIFRSLDFRFGTYHFALPLSYIEEVIRLDEVKDFSQNKFFNHKKNRYKLIDFAKVFAIPKFKPMTKYIALVDYHGHKMALPIYSNIREGAVVAKSTPRILKNKKYIRGVAVAVDGQPILIINLEDLI